MVMPLQFSLVLIVLGIILLWPKRRRQLALYLVTVGTALLLIFSNTFVSYHLVHSLEDRCPPLLQAGSGTAGQSLGQSPYIVVLSGGATDDLELPVTERLNPDSALRVVEAVEIYRSLTASTAVAANAGQPSAKEDANPEVKPRILLSGGPTLTPVPEAIPMRALAESLGVPTSAILMETRSDDTASEAKDVLPVVGHEPFILVTSAFHMPRAMALFQHLGMRPIPAPTAYLGRRSTGPFLMRIIPSARALVDSETAWHERLGMVWEHLRGQL